MSIARRERRKAQRQAKQLPIPPAKQPLPPARQPYRKPKAKGPVYAWQGIPVSFVVWEARIGEVEDGKCPWWAPFSGETRQIVQVENHKGDIYLLDNEDGSALAKLAAGGWPEHQHRGLGKVAMLRAVPQEEWHTVYDKAKAEEITERSLAWAKDNRPEVYEKVMRLRALEK